jgi:hypothetical protein
MRVMPCPTPEVRCPMKILVSDPVRDWIDRHNLRCYANGTRPFAYRALKKLTDELGRALAETDAAAHPFRGARYDTPKTFGRGHS